MNRTRAAPAFFKCWREIDAGAAPRRRNSKNNSGQQRESEREAKHAQIESWFECHPATPPKTHCQYSVFDPDREDSSEQTAQQCKKDAFGEQLSNQSPATRTQCQSQTDLFLPSGCARQQQVCNVRARDQKHEANNTEQQIERRLVVFAPVHLTLSARIRVEPRILFRIEIGNLVVAALLRRGCLPCSTLLNY